MQVVYLGLAVLIGGGLILFGVGTGSGGGGLLGAFTGNGSGGNQNQVVSQQVKTAQRQTRQSPSDPSAWSALVTAEWASARASSAASASGTSSFTSAGLQDLASATQAWQRYVALTRNPDPVVATLAARAYQYLGQYAGAASAWQVVTSANPAQIGGFVCLAANAYAAKQTRVGDLASAKALSISPKVDRPQVKAEITAAKTQPSIAQSC